MPACPCVCAACCCMRGASLSTVKGWWQNSPRSVRSPEDPDTQSFDRPTVQLFTRPSDCHARPDCPTVRSSVPQSVRHVLPSFRPFRTTHRPSAVRPSVRPPVRVRVSFHQSVCSTNSLPRTPVRLSDCPTVRLSDCPRECPFDQTFRRRFPLSWIWARLFTVANCPGLPNLFLPVPTDRTIPAKFGRHTGARGGPALNPLVKGVALGSRLRTT